MSAVDSMTIPQCTAALRTSLDLLDAKGWWQEDQDYFNAVQERLSALLNRQTANYGPVGYAKGPRPPRKLRIKDIKAGDVYKEDGKIIWTALTDFLSAACAVRVRYPDHGTGHRCWDTKDADFELPGLERP